MDAIDLVFTEFDGDKMTDICSYSASYSKDMQTKMEHLRSLVKNQTKEAILKLPEFKLIHDAYIRQIAECILDMIEKNHIDKVSVDAIGFHGKTLDHNPPSKAKIDGTKPHTLQIGSGQMLSDLTGIPVVYDFRSAPLLAGFEGAPLVSPHNAHIAITEGDGCYYNGGNTSNFAWVLNGVAQSGSDAGPFNEYIDAFIRQFSTQLYDKDGQYGKKGKLNLTLMQKLFDICRCFYERPLPKSGDPAYYNKDIVFKEIKKLYSNINQGSKNFCDIVHTLEYFAAYIAVQALTLTPKNMAILSDFILFGGGWKNSVVLSTFNHLLQGKDYVLPEHQSSFAQFLSRLKKPLKVRYSTFGEFMEARLFADLARYKLENKVWEIPEMKKCGKSVVCGVVAHPSNKEGRIYIDMLCKAF